jgi:TPR repeat protein
MERKKGNILINLVTLGLCVLPAQSVMAKTQKNKPQQKPAPTTCQTLVKSNQYAQALESCQNLADKNDKEGQYYVGMLYLQGLGTQPHQELAFKSLLKAAFNHHAQAQYQVAKLYTLGLGVERNESQAARWYLAAAKNDVKEAILVSSLINRLGVGLPKNNLQAYEYYQKAILKKITNLQTLTQASFELQKLGTPEAGQHEFERAMTLQLGLKQANPNDQAEVIRLLTQAAELGHPDALVALAECYHQGKGVAQNDLEAFTYYKKAALFGHPEGIFQVSYRYLLGQGVPQDTEQAIKWLNQAKQIAELAKKAPQQNLSQRNQPALQQPELTQLIDKTPVTAEEKYKKGLELSEENDNANFKEAIKWFSQSAQSGNKHAQYKLGMFYLTGKGLPQNYVYSYSWLNLSSAQGVPDANQAKIYLESKMTSAQLKEAQRLSEEVYAVTKENL